MWISDSESSPFATILEVLPSECVSFLGQWLKSEPLLPFGIVCQTPAVTWLGIQNVPSELFSLCALKSRMIPIQIRTQQLPALAAPPWAAQKPRRRAMLRNPDSVFFISWTSSTANMLRDHLMQTGYLVAEQNNAQRGELYKEDYTVSLNHNQKAKNDSMLFSTL